jgi:ABC-2 type transport system permease protein
MAGETASIQLILDSLNSTTANTAAAHVGSVVDSFNAEQQQKRGGGKPALVLKTRAWFNPNLDSRWNFVPALIAMLSALQTMILTALPVAREREKGTFDQLLVTAMSPAEIMMGKAIVPMLIGLSQATMVLLITLFWFDISMAGSLITLYVGLAAFVLAIVGL